MQEKESEVRRRRLWEENRRRQRNTGMITPAIHPRYGRLYRELYPDGLEQSAGSCPLFCFLCFFMSVRTV